MGLLDSLFGGNKKQRLLDWQKTVMDNSPDRLVMSEQQLRQVSIQQAQNDLRIHRQIRRGDLFHFVHDRSGKPVIEHFAAHLRVGRVHGNVDRSQTVTDQTFKLLIGNIRKRHIIAL